MSVIDRYFKESRHVIIAHHYSYDAFVTTILDTVPLIIYATPCLTPVLVSLPIYFTPKSIKMLGEGGGGGGGGGGSDKSVHRFGGGSEKNEHAWYI
jgi:hypothetical protein